MWFLILFPAAWLVSEIAKLERPARLTMGILAIIATAWLVYDVCSSEFRLMENVHNRLQIDAMHRIQDVLSRGDTNRVLAALAAHNAALPAGTIHAAEVLTLQLTDKQP